MEWIFEMRQNMTEQMIQALEAALNRGFRVELLMGKDGTIKVQTVSRKKLNIVPTP